MSKLIIRKATRADSDVLIELYKEFTEKIFSDTTSDLSTMRLGVMSLYNVVVAFIKEKSKDNNYVCEFDKDLGSLQDTLKIEKDVIDTILNLYNEYKKIEFDGMNFRSETSITLRTQIPEIYRLALVGIEKELLQLVVGRRAACGDDLCVVKGVVHQLDQVALKRFSLDPKLSNGGWVANLGAQVTDATCQRPRRCLTLHT